jgi:hypothetical protein
LGEVFFDCGKGVMECAAVVEVADEGDALCFCSVENGGAGGFVALP